jgi:hypothetical protein
MNLFHSFYIDVEVDLSECCFRRRVRNSSLVVNNVTVPIPQFLFQPIYVLKGDLFTKRVTSMFFIWRPIYTIFNHIYGPMLLI